MLHTALQLLLYALLAGLSPVAFAATIAVVPAGRLKVLGFGIAFVAAQLVTCTLFVSIGVAATSQDDHPRLRAALEFIVAAGLAWLAVQVRRKGSATSERSSRRTQELVERLGRLRFFTTLIAGVFLGIGGPKRLVLTALAATTISTAGLRDSEQGALIVFYVAVATVLVWAPVILFVFFGQRAVARMKVAQEGVARRQPHVTFYALLALAAILATDALGVLLL